MKKVILLNGSAGIGKTTISKKYIDDNPLSISIEGDQIIGMMGQWRKHEDEARELVFEHTKALVNTHLESNNDVLIPYLLTNSEHASAFEKIAKKHNAEFYEVILFAEKDEATKKLLERGVWGEEGSETLTEQHLPEIESLYDKMINELNKRPNTIKIEVIKGDVDGTYANFVKSVSGV